MGKFWFLILILISVSLFRYLDSVGQNIYDHDINENLVVENYPEFSKNIQYFETNEGRLVSNRWPMYGKGDELAVDGRFVAEKNSIWFPEVKFVAKSSNRLELTLNKIRDEASRRINLLLDHKSSELILGMLIGKNDLSKDMSDNLKSAGIIHVVVVSGQNLTMIFAFLAIGAKYFRRKIFLGLTIIIIGIYVFLVGFDPPVVRSFLMILSLVLAEVAGRKYSSVVALILTGALMLAIDPALVGEVSFQLSFLASIGVLIGIKITQAVKLPLEGYRKYLVEVYITSFFAWVMTTPVIIMSFGSVSVVAPIVNLLLLWLIPIFMVSGLVLLVLPLNIAMYGGNILQIFTKMFLTIIDFFARINRNILEANSSISLALVILGYILIFILIKLFVRHESKK